MTPIRTGLHRWWLAIPGIAVVTAALVASMGISNASETATLVFVGVWLVLALLMIVWILSSRLAVDERGRLSVAHMGRSRSVDLRRLTAVVLHPDAVAGNSLQHWMLELHDEAGGRLRMTTAPVYRRSREVFSRVDHAIKDRGVEVSGPARHVLDTITG